MNLPPDDSFVNAELAATIAEAPLIDLEAELWHAIRRAPMHCALPRHIQWGVTPISFYGPYRSLYEPDPQSPLPAFIVPVVEGGDLIDLCAIDGRSEHCGTRMGYGRALGLDAVENARWGGELALVQRPLQWLRDPVYSLYLFRLNDALLTLDGVRQFTVVGLEFAERVRALFPPSRRDGILVSA